MVPARSSISRVTERGNGRRRGGNRLGPGGVVGGFLLLALVLGGGLAWWSRGRGVDKSAAPRGIGRALASIPPPPRTRPRQALPASVQVRVLSSPDGALVRVAEPGAGGEAIVDRTTPATFSLPRGRRAVRLRVSHADFLDEELMVTPDAPRSYFVALRAVPRVAREVAPDSSDTVGREIDRFIDRYLDVRLQGCCRRRFPPAGRCGHVLLEVSLEPHGGVEELRAYENPPDPVLQACFTAVLSSAREQRFTPFPAPSRRFVRSYNFDQRR